MPKKTKRAHFLRGVSPTLTADSKGLSGWFEREEGRGLPSERVDSDAEDEPVKQFAVGEEIER